MFKIILEIFGNRQNVLPILEAESAVLLNLKAENSIFFDNF